MATPEQGRSRIARVLELQRRLREAFAPLELRISDESQLHAGHAGARDGRSHLRVHLRGTVPGGNLRDRHRAVYRAAGDLMQTDIHALAIHLDA